MEPPAKTARKKKKPVSDPTQRTFFSYLNPSRAEINKFEEIIDDLMRSEAIEKFPGLADTIHAAYKNPEEKRQAILSRLDNDRRLFTRINMRIGTKGRLSPKERVEEILIMLREYVHVGETERKLYGEVMTPVDLVEEMLYGLPPEVWTNPNLKWLDPANGCGIFPAVIVKRLMDGLETSIPDEEKRYKHIMENMLHVCELQPKNSFIYLCAFDPKDRYALNIYNGSFLTTEFDQHAQEIWGVEKFDVIVGNPPYQVTKSGFRKTQAIWQFFVEKSIELTKENGFLCIIHPAGWRNPDGLFKQTQKTILENTLLRLSLNDETAGIKTFGAETRFDHYILTKKPSKKGNTTLIKDEEGNNTKACLHGMEFIPNKKFKEVFGLLAKPNEERVEIIHSYSAYETRKEHIKEEKTKEHKFPCIYMVYQGDTINVKFSNINDRGHFGLPKLIWSNGRTASLGCIIDSVGEYGMTQFAYGIIDTPKTLPEIKKAFDSKKFRELMSACALNHDINRKVIALFRKDFWKEFI
jgi:Eco57I restriction-modification methylase